MTTNKTIHTFLNDAEEQLKNILKEQENYDEMIELVLFPSIREQVEIILANQTGAELTETTSIFLGEKKVLNNVCKDLDNVDWGLLGEGMEEKIDDLRGELREKLEEEYIKGVLDSHRKELEAAGITDMETLLNFKALIYQKKFGFVVIGKILGRTIKKLKLKDLEDLGEKLGYRKQAIEELYESHRRELEKVGITDMESLLKYGAHKYNSTFKVSIIGKILGRSNKRVILKDLEELGEKLGYKKKTNAEFLESHRKELEEVGVTNMESFLKFGRTRYKKIFGHSSIGKVLGRVIQDINRKVLQELGEKLYTEIAQDEIDPK